MRHIIATALLSSAIVAINATAKPHEIKPPKELQSTHLAQGELPHIKGIAPEIFENASVDSQIKALQIEAKSRNNLHKATQKFKDEREKEELKTSEKSIMNCENSANRVDFWA